MIALKKYLLSLLVALAPCLVLAQNGENSAYSRYGFGILEDQAQGRNKAMAGVAQGLRDGQHVNMQNPASYSAFDSLNFVFDFGMTMNTARFEQNDVRRYIRTTKLDYINIGFRLAPHLGFSMGMMPFTSVGYNYNTSSYIYDSNGQPLLEPNSGASEYTVNSYKGTGGTHFVYMGLGWEPIKGLSLGLNAGYLWGEYSHTLTQANYIGEAKVTTESGTSIQYYAAIRTYKLDFGLQYEFQPHRNHAFTLGATYGLGHRIFTDAYRRLTVNYSDTVRVPNAFQLPHTLTVGAAWKYRNNLTVAADYGFQKWSDCNFPEMTTGSDGKPLYTIGKNAFYDSHRMAMGAEYIHNPMGIKYWEHIRLRIGASYATPTTRIDGEKGPSQLCLSAGLGLPMRKNSLIKGILSNRSLVNIGFQWVRYQSDNKSLPREDSFRITLGLTFNEDWFMKMKFD